MTRKTPTIRDMTFRIELADGTVLENLDGAFIAPPAGQSARVTVVHADDVVPRPLADPVGDIKRALEALWAKAPPLDPDLVWCSVCGATIHACACGNIERIRQGIAEHNARPKPLEVEPTLLAPPPKNRHERRADKARRRQR